VEHLDQGVLPALEFLDVGLEDLEALVRDTNGSRNERTPIERLALRLVRSEAGSISAPARNVRTPLPSSARKLVHSVD
jgi:hypothetical protein